MDTDRIPVTYVFDAHCGWCWGFSEAFGAFVERHADDLDLEVVSGGLFTGSRVVPIASLGFIPEANQRVSALTGAVFGEANARLASARPTPDSPTIPPSCSTPRTPPAASQRCAPRLPSGPLRSPTPGSRRSSATG